MNNPVSPDTRSREFNGYITKSVDETIGELLGESVVPALHRHLKQIYDIDPDEIPYRLDTLLLTLEKTFGGSAQIISKAIARKFYSQIGLEFKWRPGTTLLDYVEEAKAKIGSNQTNNDQNTKFDFRRNKL